MKIYRLLAVLLLSSLLLAQIDTGGGGAGGAATWGAITGTLSSQTDLNTALGLKAPLASPTFTGTVTLPASQALTTPVLGTPTSVTLTNGTGLPESGVTSLVSDLALKAPLASPTFTGTVGLPANQTLTTPTIASFTNAAHNHTNAAGGGQITDAALSAAVTIAKGGTGTASTLTGLVRGSASAMTAAELTGDATTSGSNAVTVVKLNGTTLSSLATGLLKNTTSTGVPSIATGADVPATPVPSPSGTITLAAPRGYAICTTTCTVTVPVPAAGYEFCILNDDNVSTAITLSALGSSAMYENSARTAYGTAGTGTLVVAAALKNKVCIVGRDATHYLLLSADGGAVTVN